MNPKNPNWILLVENDPHYSETLVELMQLHGYRVLSTRNPIDAKQMSDNNSIDLAIIGVRLINDNDDKDLRGLSLASEIDPRIPKIILSGYMANELVRRALVPGKDKLPLFMDFVSKTEPFEKLDEVIRRILGETVEYESVTQEVVAFALFGDKIKLVSLSADGQYKFLDEEQNVHKILYVATSETLTLQILIEELESLVNDKSAREQDFQDFFERNPSFIINDDYKKAHPHVLLTRSDGESLIPDFVLEPADENSLSDLLELKTPLAPVFILKKARMRYSAAVLEACAQLREYSSFFDEPENRRVIQDKYGLLAYRPKMFVVIGRKGTLDPLAVRRVEHELPNLYLRTYDDIINRMKSRLARMKQGGSLV